MNDPALLADIQRRLGALEAERAVSATMHTYMRMCDTLDPSTPLDALGQLFAADAIWAGKGARYGRAFGEHRGRDAIKAMLATYCGNPPHFKFNAHFLCNEEIVVSSDLQTARGSWLMLQTSTYQDATSDLRSAELTCEFIREDRAWRIALFETQNLFSRPVDHWHGADAIPIPAQGSN